MPFGTSASLDKCIVRNGDRRWRHVLRAPAMKIVCPGAAGAIERAVTEWVSRDVHLTLHNRYFQNTF